MNKNKAKKKLKEGKARGKKLTTKQKGYMGMIAGGKMPMKKKMMKEEEEMMMKKRKVAKKRKKRKK